MARFARLSALAVSGLLLSSALAHAEGGAAGQEGSGANQQSNATQNAGAAGARGAADQSKTTLKQIQNTERSRDVTRVHKARRAHGAQD